MFLDFGDVMHSKLSHSRIFIEVHEITVAVPIDEKANKLTAAFLAQVAQETKRQLHRNGGHKEVLFRPQPDTSELLKACIEFDRQLDREWAFRCRAEIVWIALQQFLHRQTLF